MSTAYAMVASGRVDSAEVERADAEVVDVVFAWGGNVLEVKHLEAGQELVVGEAEGCDFMVPSEVLGASRACVMRREGERTLLVAPQGAQLKVNGFARSEPAIELAAGHVGEMAIGAFTLRFQTVAAPKKIAGAPLARAIQNDGLRSVLGSAFVHALAIASVALFMPSLNATDDEDMDRDRILLLQKMINVSAQKEEERQQEQAKNEGGNTGGDPLKGPEAQGDPGKAGKQEPVPTNGKMGIKGDARPQDATMQREQAKQLAASFGLIAVLSSTDPNAPSVPWGSVSNGSDSKSAIGSMFGATIDDASGSGGLNLFGTGEGGGGTSQYIGMNGLNGLGGPGHCVAGEKCDGIGNRTGALPGGHVPKGPGPMRTLSFSANGRLDPAVIQRIVQQNSGRFRQCYMMGLTRNPTLEGHVGVRFIIDRSGAVSTAVDGGSTIPDASVTSCVVRSFTSLSFPAPEGGLVTVQYGFAFSPGQ